MKKLTLLIALILISCNKGDDFMEDSNESIFGQLNASTSKSFSQNVSNVPFSRFTAGCDTCNTYIFLKDTFKLNNEWIRWENKEFRSYYRIIDEYCQRPCGHLGLDCDVKSISYTIMDNDTVNVFDRLEVISVNESSLEYSYTIDYYFNDLYFNELSEVYLANNPNLRYSNPTREIITYKIDKDTLILNEVSPNSMFFSNLPLNISKVSKWVVRNENYFPAYTDCDE